MPGNRHRDGFLDRPWIALAAGAGVLIVVVCAIVFLMGGSGNPAGLATAGGTGAASSSGQGGSGHATASSGPPGVLRYNAVMTSGHEFGDIAVPAKGAFIRIVYRGGYSGSWASGNGTGEMQNSGERLVAIEKPGNSVSAELRKLDNSAHQPLTIEIWKDGTRRAANSTSLPFGRVTASANLQDA